MEMGDSILQNGGQIAKFSNTKHGIIDKSTKWIYDKKNQKNLMMFPNFRTFRMTRKSVKMSKSQI